MSFVTLIAPGRRLLGAFAVALLAAFGLAVATPAEAQYPRKHHDRPHVQRQRPYVAPAPRVRRPAPVVRYAPRPVYREPERRHYVRPDVYAPPIVAAAPMYRRRDPWAGCASEPRVCRIPYPTHVRYGARGRYVQLWVEGSVRCDNYTFGDPMPGVRKSCAYRIR